MNPALGRVVLIAVPNCQGPCRPYSTWRRDWY